MTRRRLRHGNGLVPPQLETSAARVCIRADSPG